MRKEFTILIADRNRHVRELLKRELMTEGYKILMAKSAQEVLEQVYHNEPLDLVILDLDLPHAGGTQILEKINDRIPPLPVVVHTFLSEYSNHPSVFNAAALVEKDGASIDRLKEIVSKLLNRPVSKSPNWVENNKLKLV